jgi:hypothetical protein
MISYMNGNVSVTLLEDGTKIRMCDGLPMVRHPESLDVKITDHCTDVCAYCHEQSTPNGKHARIDELQHALQHLPTGVEIALGGGNPLTHPDLEPFLEWLTQRGLIPSITVNQKHLDEPMYFQTLSRLIEKSLVHGVGISVTKDDMTKVREIQKMTPHVVFHVIAGVNPIRSLETILSSVSDNVLVLGYKMKGRGVKHYSDEVKENLDEWYMHLSKFITKFGMSFDNLAIEQLNLKRFFTEEGWKMLYMGDDFTHSMYVDGVTQTYAPTSVSTERVSFKDMPLLEYFQKYHH